MRTAHSQVNFNHRDNERGYIVANIFEYFEAVGDWGKWHNAILEALTEINSIEGLPDNFSVDYIKYKEGVGIRIEYENAGSKASHINDILKKLEQKTL